MKVPYRVVASTIVLAAACCVSGPAGFSQQGGPGGGRGMEKPTNLQVLPKDISQQDLIKTMRQFTVDLGVRCNFCHETDPQTHRINFALDTKPEKTTARLMIRMTQAINTQYLATLPAGGVKITCYTCHRGSSMPEMQAPAGAPGAGPERTGGPRVPPPEMDSPVSPR